MEFHQETHKLKKARIPVGIRSAISSLFAFPPLGIIGRHTYTLISTQIAERVTRIRGVKSIYLVGGAVKRCIPGVSDLDFLIVIDEKRQPQIIEELDRVFSNKRLENILIGEVHIVTEGVWKRFCHSSSAVLEWYQPSLKFENGRWIGKTQSEITRLNNGSRFALSLHHYSRAIRFYSQSRARKQSFYYKSFVREVSKALAISKAESLDLRSSVEPFKLLASTYFRMSELADSILNQDKKPIVGARIENSVRGSVKFTSDMINRYLHRELKANDPIFKELTSTPRTGFFTLAENLKPIQVLELFQTYSKYLTSIEVNEKHPIPTLVSKKTFQLHSLGWNWGQLLEHMDWQMGEPSPIEQDELIRCSLARVFESWFFELTVVRGKLMTPVKSHLPRKLVGICIEGMILMTGILTRDVELLMSLTKESMPLTAEFLNSSAKRQNSIQPKKIIALIQEHEALLDQVEQVFVRSSYS